LATKCWLICISSGYRDSLFRAVRYCGGADRGAGRPLAPVAYQLRRRRLGQGPWRLGLSDPRRPRRKPW